MADKDKPDSRTTSPLPEDLQTEEKLLEEKEEETKVGPASNKEITVTIKQLTGDQCTATIRLSEKTIDLKKKIEEDVDRAPEFQLLIYAGKRLDDEKTIGSHGIKEDSVIHLVTRRRPGEPMNLYIKILEGRTISFPFCPTDTILTVKRKIREKSGIAVRDQRLIFAGKTLPDKPKLSRICGGESTFHLIDESKNEENPC